MSLFSLGAEGMLGKEYSLDLGNRVFARHEDGRVRWVQKCWQKQKIIHVLACARQEAGNQTNKANEKMRPERT